VYLILKREEEIMDYDLHYYISSLLQAVQSNDEVWKKDAIEICILNIEALLKDKKIRPNIIDIKTIISSVNRECELIVRQTGNH